MACSERASNIDLSISAASRGDDMEVCDRHLIPADEYVRTKGPSPSGAPRLLVTPVMASLLAHVGLVLTKEFAFQAVGERD